jgi:hypothetical protein
LLLVSRGNIQIETMFAYAPPISPSFPSMADGLMGSTAPFSAAMQSQAGTHVKPPVNHNLYKTELCKSFEETGSCRYGTRMEIWSASSSLTWVRNQVQSVSLRMARTNCVSF